MRAHNHQAYIRFPVDEATNKTTFDASERFRCDRTWYRWAPLTADQITIDPDSAIDVNLFDATAIADWLVHLRDLAPGFDLNRNDYDQTDPVVGKVAAQMMVDRGTLEPLELQSPHHPVRWKFQYGNDIANPKVCGTSGIKWRLPIKKDTNTISIVSSLKDHPRLPVKLENGQTTKVTIGNSIVDGKSNDIECPSKRPMPKDAHFALFYKLLRTPGAKEYIPVRIIPEQKCGSGGVPGNKSQRGSDCLGSQWP
jgi:hypothetical protein